MKARDRIKPQICVCQHYSRLLGWVSESPACCTSLCRKGPTKEHCRRSKGPRCCSQVYAWGCPGWCVSHGSTQVLVSCRKVIAHAAMISISLLGAYWRSSVFHSGMSSSDLHHKFIYCRYCDMLQLLQSVFAVVCFVLLRKVFCPFTQGWVLLLHTDYLASVTEKLLFLHYQLLFPSLTDLELYQAQSQI